MMLVAVGTAALRTALLAGAVHLCLRLLGVRGPQLSLTCWTAVVAASLAMPLLQQLAILPPSVWTPLPAEDLATLGDTISMSPAHLFVPMSVDGPSVGSLWHWLSAVYVVIAGSLLLRLLLGLGLSGRLLRQAEALALNGARDLRVRVSPGVSGPVTLGGTVLLPQDCAAWPEDRLRAVLSHERAHARAGDFYVLLLSQVNRALFWFSPVSWWLHQRLTMLAEMASDDVAIAELGDRIGYARILLDIGRRTSGVSAGVMMARPATVERRIERVLAGGDVPARAGGVERILVAAGVFSLAAVAAAPFVGRTGVNASPRVFQPPSYKGGRDRLARRVEPADASVRNEPAADIR